VLHFTFPVGDTYVHFQFSPSATILLGRSVESIDSTSRIEEMLNTLDQIVNYDTSDQRSRFEHF
jgi:hypothetical protein